MNVYARDVTRAARCKTPLLSENENVQFFEGEWLRKRELYSAVSLPIEMRNQIVSERERGIQSENETMIETEEIVARLKAGKNFVDIQRKISV